MFTPRKSNDTQSPLVRQLKTNAKRTISIASSVMQKIKRSCFVQPPFKLDGADSVFQHASQILLLDDRYGV